MADTEKENKAMIDNERHSTYPAPRLFTALCECGHTGGEHIVTDENYAPCDKCACDDFSLSRDAHIPKATGQNLVIRQTEYDGINLELSNYAAHALLRRLQGGAACDDVETKFVEDAVREIEKSLQ